MTEPTTEPTRVYHGSCHCGAVRFTFRDRPIERGIRCNCSFCARKGALMSTRYYAPEEFDELVGVEKLANYLFGDVMVNHFFCKTCGIHPFHDAIEKPGHYRVNLGCIDGLDPQAIAVDWIDGRSF